MSVDDTRLQFSSNWEIDQRRANGETSVGTGATFLYTATEDDPVTDMIFQPSGSTRWFMQGVNSHNNAVSGKFLFYAYTIGKSVYISTTYAGTVRWYVYTDTVDYP